MESHYMFFRNNSRTFRFCIYSMYICIKLYRFNQCMYFFWRYKIPYDWLSKGCFFMDLGYILPLSYSISSCTGMHVCSIFRERLTINVLAEHVCHRHGILSVNFFPLIPDIPLNKDKQLCSPSRAVQTMAVLRTEKTPSVTYAAYWLHSVTTQLSFLPAW